VKRQDSYTHNKEEEIVGFDVSSFLLQMKEQDSENSGKKHSRNLLATVL
jgi:hypothetical protein